jgi:carbon-monoxide dehydrogenase large subunit
MKLRQPARRHNQAVTRGTREGRDGALDLAGVAQGLGQVLMEDKTYDRETGQVPAGSFMDYAMPRRWTSRSRTIRCRRRTIRGAGEAGTVGSLPAGVDAIVLALSGYGIRHVDMPRTSYSVWRALEEAKKGPMSAYCQ